MIEFKPGAEPKRISLQILATLPKIHRIFEFYGFDCIVTCTTGSHGPDDPHTHGYAWDFRTKHIPDQEIKEYIVEDIQNAVGDLFFVQYEEGKDDPETDEIEHEGEHVHAQVRKDLWPKLMKG